MEYEIKVRTRQMVSETVFVSDKDTDDALLEVELGLRDIFGDDYEIILFEKRTAKVNH